MQETTSLICIVTDNQLCTDRESNPGQLD
jgi:hypothetical protein